ncbi:MAG TPA: bifunctional phosphopantothenoylcysteine decarboxylase/phosphopantothenate--cysteine ligase CoaBC, partial [Actinomycetota bacterium]
GMWEHPATSGNVEILRSRGVRFVGPESGALAHGDEGMGRMSEPGSIIAEAAAALGDRSSGDLAGDLAGDLDGRVVVVTAGPTYEAIDPVRFLGNHSSGKMGVAVASEARRRGAHVRLVLGPGTVAPPPGVDVERVTSAEEMRAAVMRHLDTADIVVMAAAVADFRPKRASSAKISKDEGAPDLALEPTPDILRELGEVRRPGMVLVGFAAETSDVEAAGRAKLASKGVDLLIANEVGRPGTGFGSDTDHAAVIDRAGNDVPLRRWTKAELATELLDRAVTRLG